MIQNRVNMLLLLFICAVAGPVNFVSAVAYPPSGTLHRVAVPASILKARGAGRVSTVGPDLQSAIDSAAPGDTLVLRAGMTFTGNFVLPARRRGNGWITLVSDSANLPGPGVRVGPADAPSMPRLLSPNELPAIRTVAGSQFVQLIGIEIGLAPGVVANDGLVLLGDGSTPQKSLDRMPHDFLIDRCYVHGNALSNSKRGIALNCSAAVVQNSYVSDFHAVGFDTQAIEGWNGPGPFTISNNYLEAAGENVMFGGADPTVPNLIPSDIQIEHNLFSKPLAWMNGILGQVAQVQPVGAMDPNGALVPGLTYYYRISAAATVGGDTVIRSPASTETVVTLGTALGTSSQNAVSLTWTPVPDAAAYLIFRTTDPPSTHTRGWATYKVDAPVGGFIDLGAQSSEPASSPSDQGTRWSVKNLLELKNSERVLIQGNIFQNNWLDAQTGYAILFKSVNQDGSAPWSSTTDVTFTDNVVSNVASGVNIQGSDPDHPSGQTCCISIRNNLFYGIDGAALGGGDGTFLQITNVNGCLVDHNTVIQSGNLMTAYGDSSTGFAFSNNIAPGNTYGVKGDGTASGDPTLSTYFPNGLFKKNVIVGASASSYPRNNYYPASLSDVGFADIKNANFRLSSTSPFLGAGTKGSNIGADIDRINKEVGGILGPN